MDKIEIFLVKIQDDSSLMDVITAVDGFLGLCDKNVHININRNIFV